MTNKNVSAVYVIKHLLEGDRKLPAPSFTLKEVEALETAISELMKTYEAPEEGVPHKYIQDSTGILNLRLENY